MRGTRLWQEAQSPLISGVSRRAKPFWSDWLLAVFAAVISGALVLSVYITFKDGDLPAAARGLMPAVAAGAAIGAIPGVWLGGKLGARRRWTWGVVPGALLAVIAAYSFAQFLLTRLGG